MGVEEQAYKNKRQNRGTENPADAVQHKEAKQENVKEEKAPLTVEELKRELARQKAAAARANEEYRRVWGLYQEILHSRYWRATKPLRAVTGLLKKLKNGDLLRRSGKALKILLRQGPAALLRAIRGRRDYTSKGVDYTAITKEKRKREEAAVFPKTIKFSILVPLYNTPIPFLKEMIGSVQAQTYPNWELCLADGSDAEHGNVRECVEKLQKADKRIAYRKLEKNLGIAENTNVCMAMATGDYIGLFDHDDVLHPSALFEMMKAICEHGADFIYTDEATFTSPNICNIVTFHFKPDYAIDNLRAVNYICHFTVFSKELLDKTGGFRNEYDGSQDHDLILRLTANAQKVYHIRKLLYFWRSHPQSVAMSMGAKDYAINAGKRAVRDSIRASGYECTVESSQAHPTMYRIRYALKIHPLVTILIPNMNHKEDLKRCIDSIRAKTTYDNYEILIVENNSTEPEIFDYYRELENEDAIRVVTYTDTFNYSRINNFGAQSARGEYLILLNNDTEIITPAWIEEMLMYAQRPEVGIVGAKLYYPDGTVQHAGVIVGQGGVAGHTHCHIGKEDPGYMGKMFYAQDLSAVTAACLMVEKALFDQIGGLDSEFAVAFNDVDFCLRVREQHRLVVFTPYAELYHYESKSRGYEDTPEKQMRFAGEIALFHEKWDEKFLQRGDPYYNPNFSLMADYQLLRDKIYHDCVEA